MVGNGQKQTETNRNKQIQTETDKNRQKRTKMNRNRQQLKETVRYGLKQTEADRKNFMCFLSPVT